MALSMASRRRDPTSDGVSPSRWKNLGPRLFLAWLLGLGLWPPAGVDAAGPTDGETVVLPGHRLFLPVVTRHAPGACPQQSQATFAAVPIQGPPSSRQAAQHPDLNLVLRGYVPTSAPLTLVDVDGPTDGDPPQLAAIFSSPRLPPFTAAYQVYDWDWQCTPDGCRGAPIAFPPVTLLELAAHPGEPLTVPDRGASIWTGHLKAMVLYAESRRITLAYTREDTAAVGYLVHMEGICVDVNLLALYRQLDSAGRTHLPALSGDDVLGTAADARFRVAIRDTGSFMDPRSRKDWWQGY